MAQNQEQSVSGWRRYSSSPAAVLAVAAAAGAVIGGVLVALTTSDSQDATCRAMSVAERTLPSVVTILTRNGTAGGNGSGEVIRSGGYILTNDHVISSAADGGEVSVLYSDGHTSPASIVGRDTATDLAVIKADDGAAGFPLITFTSSAAVRVGQPVVALGCTARPRQHGHRGDRERLGPLCARARRQR